MIQHFDKQLKGVLWPIDQYFERNLGLIQPPISVINWRRWTQKVVRRRPNSTTPWSPHVVFKKQEDLCGGIINPVRLTGGNTLPQLCGLQSKTLGILQPWTKLGLLLIAMRENIHGGGRGEGPDCVRKRTKLERSHRRTWTLARRFAEERVQEDRSLLRIESRQKAGQSREWVSQST